MLIEVKKPVETVSVCARPEGAAIVASTARAHRRATADDVPSFPARPLNN
jgi:hypothetical protein